MEAALLVPNDTFSHPIASACFTRYFEHQAALTPDAIAIEFEGHRLTYAELNRQANRIAHRLNQIGFQPETRIGICLDRSIAAVQCMLGILKAGLAFVPLDPEFPPDRLAYIVEHAGVRHIFCDAGYRSLFPAIDETHVTIGGPDAAEFDQADSDLNNELSGDLDNDLDNDLEIDVPLNSLAYVMYTSGSTGKPKGVQIEHGSLMTYCLADIEVYRLESADRTLQFSTLNFDVAIEEIFPPLLVGSTIVIRPRERAEAAIELSHLIETYDITALHIATAYWNEWVDLMVAAKVRVPSSLRLTIVTGEKISVEHYRRWKSLCDQPMLWCNAYGPTETTVTCTVFIPDSQWDEAQMPIGRPLPGYEAVILDEAMRPVEPGQTGHLFIGGPALARGYLDRPDLTEKAFITLTLPETEQPRRLYRTGDLARWLPTGDIEFSGRVDHQMKIGSYRIEPGEIESVLNLHPDVRESLVTCEESGGQKYLIGNVVSISGQTTPRALADFLRERLPVYMVPTRYAILDCMPKTINGKIDRAALPKGDALQGIATETDNQPTTELERLLVSVWKSVLQLPNVGIDDDFFQMGGSSLLVARVIAQLSRQLQIAVPVRDFFANPTIATLANHLEMLRKGPQSEPRWQHQIALRQRLPMIRALELESRGAKLASVHYPAVQGTTPGRSHAVLIAQPYGHEYTRAHRNLQQLAAQLAQQGFDVVRFDYAGTGDSDGEADRLHVEQWTADISQTVQAIHAQLGLEKLSLVGVRLGANLLDLTPIEQVANFIAWDPVISGKDFLANLQKMHRQELNSLTRFLQVRATNQDELLGYCWPARLQREIAELTWAACSAVPAQRRWWLTTHSKNISNSKLDSTSVNGSSSMQTDKPVRTAWQKSLCADEIYWDQLTYANSAFVSLRTTQAILNILTERA
ncbi:MAG: amino acid adenylation domain-containing protein [Pirellulaceae bacterium]|nr:amino acid adenylation domain-containing protein [Pirellulaceae bacterium]